MPPGDLPHARRPSVFESAWAEFRRSVSAPIGCLVLLLCLPLTVLAVIVLMCVALWRGFRAGRTTGATGPSAGRVGAGRDVSSATAVTATALFVRTFAGDASFTRDEAVQAAVPAAGGRTAAQLLADAIRVGWIAERGDGTLVVTDTGRQQVDELLRARGL